MINALTVDVEEYFHATEVQNAVGSKSWDLLPSRIEFQLQETLHLLDAKHVKATFFILGWVAERFPKLIRDVADAGHEIGCHSYAHRLVYDLTPQEFRADTLRAAHVIHQACGILPKIYRAPSYSITENSIWCLKILVECGFTHDSSIFPISHDRYGIPHFNRMPHAVTTLAGSIVEVPGSTVRVGGGKALPIGGGGYLRLLPYAYVAAGIRKLHREDRAPACIYFHPWELDPQMPRLPLGMIGSLRTYTGLNGMKRKIERLLDEFEFSTISAVYPVPRSVVPQVAGVSPASAINRTQCAAGD